MSRTVTLNGRTFALSIPEKDILSAVGRVAERIGSDLRGRTPLFLIVLDGAFIFAADLLRHISVPAEISFVKLSSYSGAESSGHVNEIIGLTQSVEGRTVVIVEDIVDSGLTMKRMTDILRSQGADDIRIAALLYKPASVRHDIKLDYVAIGIPDDFIVGYGLDYCGLGRNLRDIYTVTD